MARVTIRAFSLSPPIRIPFTKPMRAATPTAVRIAIQIRLSDCSPTPAMIIAASVNVPGVLRSMPPVMITNIWPRAVIASSAANGAIADKADPAERFRNPDRCDNDQNDQGEVDRHVAGSDDEPRED